MRVIEMKREIGRQSRIADEPQRLARPFPITPPSVTVLTEFVFQERHCGSVRRIANGGGSGGDHSRIAVKQQFSEYTNTVGRDMLPESGGRTTTNTRIL